MNDKKRKNKQYYVNQAKRAKYEKNKLRPGLRGFLCTTNNRERECVREAYNLLNEFANDMYGPEMEIQEPSDRGDVEDSLQAELAALKKENTTKVRRFQQCDSGAKNCIFINTQLEQTSPLVERIAEQIQSTGTQRTRYLLRMLPVQVTCKATEEDIRASAEQMIKDTFTEIGVTYTTVFRSRNQSQLTQTDAQSAVNQLIDAVCPTAKLDHKTPQLTVCMEAIKNVLCLGVVRDFFKRRKYNLVELARPLEDKESQSTAEQDVKNGDERDTKAEETPEGPGQAESEKDTPAEVTEDVAEKKEIDVTSEKKEAEETSNDTAIGTSGNETEETLKDEAEGGLEKESEESSKNGAEGALEKESEESSKDEAGGTLEKDTEESSKEEAVGTLEKETEESSKEEAVGTLEKETEESSKDGADSGMASENKAIGEVNAKE